MLYKVVLTFESVDEILKCDHSNESYCESWAVLSCGAVYYALQGGSTFGVGGWNPEVWPFKWKLLSSTFLWCCLFIMLYKVFQTFESVDEILKCDNSNESCEQYFQFLLCFYSPVRGHSNFWVCGWNLTMWPLEWKLLSSTFLCGTVYILYMVVQPFESVDEIIKHDHSSESYWAVLSCGAVYYAVQGGSNLRICGWYSKVWPFKWKLLSSTFLWCCLLICCTGDSTVWAMHEILKSHH